MQRWSPLLLLLLYSYSVMQFIKNKASRTEKDAAIIHYFITALYRLAEACLRGSRFSKVIFR